MLKIRLQRFGRKNDPSFRAVCVDSRKGPKTGKHVEVLGSYDPKRRHVAIKSERVKYWISKGAKVSDTMHNLLVKEGIIKGKKIHVAKEKKKEEKVKEETKTEIPTEKPKESKEEIKKEVKEEVKTENPTEAPEKEIKEEAKESESEAPKKETKEEVIVEEKEEQETVEGKKEVV